MTKLTHNTNYQDLPEQRRLYRRYRISQTSSGLLSWSHSSYPKPVPQLVAQMISNMNGLWSVYQQQTHLWSVFHVAGSTKAGARL